MNAPPCSRRGWRTSAGRRCRELSAVRALWHRERALWPAPVPARMAFALRQTLCLSVKLSGSNSVGRVSASQAECRGFESRLPLQHRKLNAGPSANSAVLFRLGSCLDLGRRGTGALVGAAEHGGGRRAAAARASTYRKVTARLRREQGVFVGRYRVPRLLRDAGLLAPQRARGRHRSRAHDGSIIPEGPNRTWGTDATMAYTSRDGWVWAFACVDHWSAGAWASVARRGDPFAAIEPIYDAVRDRFDVADPDVARGISLRRDWGPSTRARTSAHPARGLCSRCPGGCRMFSLDRQAQERRA